MPSQKHPKDADVIIGKSGKRYVNLPGNIAFQKLVKNSCSKYYKMTSAQGKKRIIQLIVEKVERWGGRFITMNEKETAWVKADDFSTSEKIRQAMSNLWHKRGLKEQHLVENSTRKIHKKASGSTSKSRAKFPVSQFCATAPAKTYAGKIAQREPKEADVIAGNLPGFVEHPGNIWLREETNKVSATYGNKSAQERKDIVSGILKEVHNRGGRFIEKSDDSSHWVPVDDVKARIKICKSISNWRRNDLKSAPRTNGTSLRKEEEKQPIKKHSITKFPLPIPVATSPKGHTCSFDASAYQFDHYMEPFDRTQKKVEGVLELSPTKPKTSCARGDLAGNLIGKIKSEADLTCFLTDDFLDGDTKRIAIGLQHALGFIENIGIEKEDRSIVYHNILGLAHRYPEEPTIQCICLEILTKSLERFDPPHGAGVGDSRVAVKALKSFELHEELQKLAIGFLSTVIDRDFAKEHSSVILGEDGLLHLCTAATRYSEDAPVLCDVFSIFSSMLDCGAEILDELLRLDMFSVADKSLEQFPGNKRLLRRVEDLRKHIDTME